MFCGQNSRGGLRAAAVFPSGKVTQPGPVYSAATGLSESSPVSPSERARPWALPCESSPAPALAETTEAAMGSTQSLGRGPLLPTCERSCESRIRKPLLLSVFPCRLSVCHRSLAPASYLATELLLPLHPALEARTKALCSVLSPHSIIRGSE